MKHDFIKTRDSFREVLYNSDDQVIVRELIDELVPDDIKNEILWRFNKYISERNLRAVILNRAER